MDATHDLTLTEFLLACIADDEERARFVQREVARGRGPATWEAWRLSWHDEYDLLCIEPERALAECEAKRGVVEDLTRFLSVAVAAGAADDHPTLLAGLTLQIQRLALPYADHPDYREEWKP